MRPSISFRSSLFQLHRQNPFHACAFHVRSPQWWTSFILWQCWKLGNIGINETRYFLECMILITILTVYPKWTTILTVSCPIIFPFCFHHHRLSSNVSFEINSLGTLSFTVALAISTISTITCMIVIYVSCKSYFQCKSYHIWILVEF